MNNLEQFQIYLSSTDCKLNSNNKIAASKVIACLHHINSDIGKEAIFTFLEPDSKKKSFEEGKSHKVYTYLYNNSHREPVCIHFDADGYKDKCWRDFARTKINFLTSIFIDCYLFMQSVNMEDDFLASIEDGAGACIEAKTRNAIEYATNVRIMMEGEKLILLPFNKLILKYRDQVEEALSNNISLKKATAWILQHYNNEKCVPDPEYCPEGIISKNVITKYFRDVLAYDDQIESLKNPEINLQDPQKKESHLENIQAPKEQKFKIEKVSIEQLDHKKAMQPTVITLSALQKYFLPQLDEIKIKEQDLRNRGHITAADSVLILYNTLKIQHNEFIEGKINTQTFKNSCTDAINTARPKLEKHRGWKQILGNLAFAVVGLGGLYVAAAIINKAATGNFLFFKTDSANKLDKLDKHVLSL